MAKTMLKSQDFEMLQKSRKGHYFGRYISNKAYKSIDKYSDSPGMNLRVISRKVKNRSKSKTIKVL